MRWVNPRASEWKRPRLQVRSFHRWDRGSDRVARLNIPISRNNPITSNWLSIAGRLRAGARSSAASAAFYGPMFSASVQLVRKFRTDCVEILGQPKLPCQADGSEDLALGHLRCYDASMLIRLSAVCAKEETSSVNTLANSSERMVAYGGIRSVNQEWHDR
jgi:hypothetical protein